MLFWCVEQRCHSWRRHWQCPERFYPEEDDVGYPAHGLSRDEAVALASRLNRHGGLWRFRVRAY